MTGIKQNDDPALGEVLFEFLTVGNAVRVSAVHVASNTEVTLIGAPGMTPFTLKANALRKLKMALERRGGV